MTDVLVDPEALAGGLIMLVGQLVAEAVDHGLGGVLHVRGAGSGGAKAGGDVDEIVDAHRRNPGHHADPTTLTLRDRLTIPVGALERWCEVIRHWVAAETGAVHALICTHAESA